MARALIAARVPGIARVVPELGLLALALAVWGWSPPGLRAAELRESLAEGFSTQVRIELKAEGLFRPGLPPSATTEETKMPKPLGLEVKTRLVFNERVARPAAGGGGGGGGRGGGQGGL